MKKIIPILFCFFVLYQLGHTDDIIIPESAIRFRVIANSDSIFDQTVKMQVKKILESKLNNYMSEAKDSLEAAQYIQNNLADIRKEVDKWSKDNSVSFGENYFPSKTYKGVTYPSGNYQSLVVTLGNGKGENWWCVMFPPLCLLDMKEQEMENKEYRFYVKDVLQNYFS